MSRTSICSILCFLSVVVTTSRADEDARPKRPIDGIMDNSFLIEEAYNQEPGVVQHILTASYALNYRPGPDDRIWALNFTEEWPVFSQAHQFSYSVPYLFASTAGQDGNGFGDILLNYRYQAYFDEATFRAFAPRASIVLPTGRRNLGFSDDTVGAQFNLPFSAAWGDRWFTHFNAGLTWLPDAYSTGGQDALHYNLGASVIYAAWSDCHLMLEWTGMWLNVPNRSNGLRYEFLSVISPGVRKAFNFGHDAQFVLGVAAPIGLTAASPDIGVFLYVSFEHRFLPTKE